MTTAPRVALFTDSYHEANGVARTATALEAYAMERDLPMLVVHGGRATQLVETGSVQRLELRRSWASFDLEHDLRFDLALWRHAGRVAEAVRDFHPDVLHFTGPSDVGQLGASLGHRLGIPMVASWHTNLHEYASRRLQARLAWMPDRARLRIAAAAERHTLALAVLFYRIPRVVLAPNDEWARRLHERTATPTFTMTRGVDTALFTPDRRARTDDAVNIGYVGRLSPEKNVRLLAAVASALASDGARVRFTIVGEGRERAWLEGAIPQATFTGTLRGEALADAYANLDVFVFPSETETVGNVVLEAMASGVPVVALDRGGHRFVVDRGASAALAASGEALVDVVSLLVHDPQRREEMGRRARDAALARSWESVFDGVYRAYDVALSAARHRGRPVDEPLGPPAEERPFA